MLEEFWPEEFWLEEFCAPWLRPVAEAPPPAGDCADDAPDEEPADAPDEDEEPA